MRRLAAVLCSLLLVIALGAAVGHAVDPTQRLAAFRAARATPFALPDFSLVAVDGSRVSRRDLVGRVWVADFVFLQCGGACDLVDRRRLAWLRGAAGRDVGFVTFSVDASDGAPALARYRRRAGMPAGASWRLLAADATSFPSFAVAMGLAASIDDVPAAFALSSRFVFLIDREGVVRGSYDATSDADARRLAADLAALVAGGPT